MEVGRLGANPGDETSQLGIGSQARDVGQASGDLGLGVAGVDGAVTDLMQPHRAEPGTAAGARHKVMQAAARAGRDRPPA